MNSRHDLEMEEQLQESILHMLKHGLTIHLTDERRPGYADPLARIEKELKIMNDNVSRLVTSVDNLAIAIDNQNASIAEVATAIRNHPASTTDNGTLSSLADRLDSITTSLNNSTAALHGLAGEENTEDATGDSATPAEEPPVDPAPLGGADDSSGADAASGADASTDTTTDASASDGSGNDGSTGEASGDASSSDASSGDSSGEAPADPAA